MAGRTYKTYHLNCSKCNTKFSIWSWEHEVPMTCACGGFYMEVIAGGKPVANRVESDPLVIMEELNELRFPEHLGG